MGAACARAANSRPSLNVSEAVGEFVTISALLVILQCEFGSDLAFENFHRWIARRWTFSSRR